MLRHRDSLVVARVQLPRSTWDPSSPTRDQTSVLCIGRRSCILNHQTSRKSLHLSDLHLPSLSSSFCPLLLTSFTLSQYMYVLFCLKLTRVLCPTLFTKRVDDIACIPSLKIKPIIKLFSIMQLTSDFFFLLVAQGPSLGETCYKSREGIWNWSTEGSFHLILQSLIVDDTTSQFKELRERPSGGPSHLVLYS